MGIDASIYGQIQAPKENNLLGQYAQMQQIQGAQNQNRLADLMYGEKQRDIASSRAMDDAYRGAIGTDGVIDRQKLYASIAQTSGRQLPAVQKGFAETDKAEIESKKNAIALQRDKLAFAGQILGSVTDQTTYDAARQTATSNGLDVSNMPAQYDPGFVAGKLKEAMTVKEQLEQKWKQMEYTTPNANTVASNENRILTTGMTNDVSRRGQDKAAETAALGRAQSAAQHASTLEAGKQQIVQTDNGPVLVNTRTGSGMVVNGPDGQPLPGVTKPLNDSQSKALLFGSRMREADKALATLSSEGKVNSFAGSRAPVVGGAINALSTENNQMLNQAKTDFMSAVLRRESGAAISSGEYDTANKQYFPQIGDAPGVIAQKAANRQLALKGILLEVPEKHRNSLQPAAGGPKPGAVQDGYRFKGGNPSDPKSWEKM